MKPDILISKDEHLEILRKGYEITLKLYHQLEKELDSINQRIESLNNEPTERTDRTDQSSELV